MKSAPPMPLNAFHQLKAQVQPSCTRVYKARGIKVKRCPLCQLMPAHCICSERPTLSSNIDFILLYHLDEIFKPTNTGRLIADIFPENTFAFRHSRKDPPEALLNLLSDPERECVIVFPTTGQTNRKVVSQLNQSSNKKLTFVILDGTWRQGRRMFNGSEWLKEYLVLKLKPEEKSRYSTRKASNVDLLSTAESAALALAKAGEETNAKSLFNYFNLFNQSYMKMKPRR